VFLTIARAKKTWTRNLAQFCRAVQSVCERQEHTLPPRPVGWRIAINASRSTTAPFAKTTRCVQRPRTVKFFREKIQWVETARYLRVTLDWLIMSTGVILRPWTAATNGPIVHPPRNTWAWSTTVTWCRLGKTPDLPTRALWQSYQLSHLGETRRNRRKWEFYLVSISFTLASDFYMRKILRHGASGCTSEGTCAEDFLSPLKIHRLDRVWTIGSHPWYMADLVGPRLQVGGKATQRLGVLGPLLNRTGLSTKNGVLFYKQLIRPMVDYACPIWRPAARNYIQKLQVLLSIYIKANVCVCVCVCLSVCMFKINSLTP
jgi:hypothetical protein